MPARKPDSVRYGLKMGSKEFTIPYSEVSYRGKAFRYAETGRIGRKRVDTLFTKEPTTIDWLEMMGKDDVLLDVGANVGTYTVYAAVWAGCQVYALEPEAQNYAILNQNIYLNRLDRRAQAFCVAATDEDHRGLSTLYLSALSPSYSHHDFGTNAWRGPVTKLAPSADARFRQGCLGLEVDMCLQSKWLPPPTHVKIDVDGFESRVVGGMGRLLDDSRLKTVLIETDYSIPDSVRLIDVMRSLGFDFSRDQVCLCREGKLDVAEWERRVASGGGGGCNIIYFRDPAYHRLFKEAADRYLSK